MINIQDINNINAWKKTQKKNYDVYVCRPNIGSRVYNKLENANYVTDQNKQFVISGTVGETWVIDANKLAKTYCFMNGESITPEALMRRVKPGGKIDWMHLKTRPGGGGINYAFHLPLSIRNFPVKTSWGDVLYANSDVSKHGMGDFLVCAADEFGRPNLNDIWVVNGEVFPTTYDLRSFGHICNSSAKITPKPNSIL